MTHQDTDDQTGQTPSFPVEASFTTEELDVATQTITQLGLNLTPEQGVALYRDVQARQNGDSPGDRLRRAHASSPLMRKANR